MASKQVSGGDMYIKKFIEYSGYVFDAITSGHGKRTVDKKTIRNFYITDTTEAAGSLALSWLYIQRIIKAVWSVHRSSISYDAILASSPFLPDILPAVVRRSNNRVVVFFHLIPERTSKDIRTRIRFMIAGFEQKIALVIIGRYFNTILAGNVNVQSVLKERFPNKKIVIADAGIDTTLIDSFVSEKKQHDKAVFIGRLTTQKGILDLVHITNEIQKKHPRFSVDVIGDGQDRHLLEKTIRDSGVSNITLHGFVDEQTKYSLLKQATFFIFPSYEEGWGIALAEGLYAENLVFCYELPHYRSIFNDYPYYSPVGDWKKMSSLILTNYNKKVHLNQKKFASKYDDKYVIEAVLKQIG